MRSVCSALLLLLVVCVCEGRNFSKCQLKSDLESARLPLTAAMGEKMSEQDLIARLVCLANSTGFNSNFVNNITAMNHTAIKPPPPPPPPPPKDTHNLPHPPPPPASSIKPQQEPPIMHQYGLFQFSDQVACDSGSVPSLNICNISCSALINDDITDDINCLKTLITATKPKPKEKPSEVKQISEMLMVKECHSVNPAHFFSHCT